MVRYTSDEDDDWIYGLVWRRAPLAPLYWSIWVGWTLVKEQAFTLTNGEVIRAGSSTAFDDRLPLAPENTGEWMPIYRRYSLYGGPVIDDDDLVDC